MDSKWALKPSILFCVSISVKQKTKKTEFLNKNIIIIKLQTTAFQLSFGLLNIL